MYINILKKTKKIATNIFLTNNFLNIVAMNNNNNNENKNTCEINNIKSILVKKKIFNNVPERNKLNLIKYNKTLQKNLKKNIDDYQRFKYIIIYVEGINKDVTFINKNEFNEKKIIIKDTKVSKFKKILIEPTVLVRYFSDFKESLFSNLGGIVSVRIIKCYYDSSYSTSLSLNFSNLFSGCTNLKKVIFQDDNEFFLDNAGEMFKNCINLEHIEGLNNLNTYGVVNIKGLFQNCKSLKYIKGIEKWKLWHVRDMSSMFEGCSSLICLPDISNWRFRTYYETGHRNMSALFKNCSSLVTLPDISNWNTNRVNLMKEMFSGCQSLISLPDISKWDTPWLESTEKMFDRCYSLVKIPNLEKWPYRMETADAMFKDCINIMYFFNLKHFDYYHLNINNTIFN